GLVRDRVAPALVSPSVPHLPWIGEAVARASVAVAGASLVIVAALSAGAIVLRVLGWTTTSRAERIVFSAVTGIVVVSCASLLLALVGRYRPLPVAILIAALILAGVPAGLSCRARWRPGPARVDAAAAAWIAIAAVALAFGLVASLAPEVEY